jgi:alpha-1,3-mannosyltransferase
MRITHVVRQFHPAVGGLEDVVKNLANAQNAQGHDVRIVTLDRIFNSKKRARLPKHERRDGLEIVRVPFFGSRRYPIALSALKHVRDADIVHVHGIDFFFDYLAWTKPLHRRKLVVSTHGGFFHTGFAATLKQLYFQTVTRLSLTWYSGVATVSASDDALFRKVRPRGRRLIENGVDTAKYLNAGSPTPQKRLLSMGRLSSNKRLDLVIRFLAALRRLDPQWTLCIAGRPWDVAAADLHSLAEELGAGDAIEIIENPSERAISALMAECSAFVTASDYEGFGLAVIEGMSAGLWPVVSGIPPFKYLVEKTGVGTVLDFTKPDAAARFLTGWDSADYEPRRAAAIAAAGRYHWRHVSADYETLYRSALGDDVRTILDVPVLVRTSPEAINLLDERFQRGAPNIVAFANAHTLNMTAADPAVRSILDRSIVFNDGVGLDIASRVLFGKAFPENLNGTDFVPHYLRQSQNRYRIFLVGAKPGVAERAARKLGRLAPGHEIVGLSHGYVPRAQMPELIARIRRARADVLLVAMGNPEQEAWLNRHLPESGCRLGFGVGALFDFLADDVARAPAWMRSARIEWIFRMLQEPRRLWRRYLVDMPVFLARVLRQWLAGPRVSRVAQS